MTTELITCVQDLTESIDRHLLELERNGEPLIEIIFKLGTVEYATHIKRGLTPKEKANLTGRIANWLG